MEPVIAAGPPGIVIGNGSVDETTALLLAWWGIPVIVLDARPEREMLGSSSRPFAGRPPRGQVLPPLPGVIVPDMPSTDPQYPDASRLRDIVRDSILVLVADDVVPNVVHACAAGLTTVPVRTVALRTLTPNGRLAALLGAQPGAAWVIRPDGHIAAVVPAADEPSWPAPSAGSWPCPYRRR
jgi:hypothetical protein